MAYTNQKPLVFKRGAIYRIVGNSCAHYRGVAYENYLVFSVHGKPFVVERDRVEVASKRDVEFYLKDGNNK